MFSLVATGVIVVLFQPLRGWLQRGINRFLYGQREEPYQILAQLGSRLAAVQATEAILPAIVETARDTLHLPYVAIYLNRNPGWDETRVSAGTAHISNICTKREVADRTQAILRAKDVGFHQGVNCRKTCHAKCGKKTTHHALYFALIG